jgi:hypothetical protein
MSMSVARAEPRRCLACAMPALAPLTLRNWRKLCRPAHSPAVMDADLAPVVAVQTAHEGLICVGYAYGQSG